MYVFKHAKKWRLLAIYNVGMQGLSVEAAVANLTQPDNSCMLTYFDGGQIDIKYRVDKTNLFVDYALNGEKTWTSCIAGKSYPGLHSQGYYGISSGNPVLQNVNDIDVHRIDFFNQNYNFYKHGADGIV